MLRTATISALALACAQQAASAQDLPPADEAAPRGEIIVTAQKREQDLQDVPVVVNVLNARQLSDAGVRDIKDLQTIVPGLIAVSTTSVTQTSFRIRGIGTLGDNPGLESSVGTVIDGVYRARSAVAFGDLGEMERIEVIKGPQSTLFGKNMSAGVISVVTAAPVLDQAGAEFAASYGNYNAWSVSGSVNLPLVQDKVAARIFGIKRERDGFMRVSTGAGPSTSTESSTEDYYSLRGQVLLAPSDAFSLRIIGDYSDRDEDCCLSTLTISGTNTRYIDALAADAGVNQPPAPFGRTTYANRDSIQRIRDWGVSAEAGLDLGGGLSATSITAYRHWRGAYGNDLDFSSADLYVRPVDRNVTRFGLFSQEARLAYQGGPLNSILGVYYAAEQVDVTTANIFGADYERYFGLQLSGGTDPNYVSVLTGLPVGTNFVAGRGQIDDHAHRTHSFAVFTDHEIALTDALTLSLGLRYTDEVKRVTSRFTNTAPGNACAAALTRPIPASAVSALCAIVGDPAFDNVTSSQRRAERRLSGSAKASYRFADSVTGYVSYANGFKSGGFNLDRARFSAGRFNPDTAFAAETVESYEAGLKTQWFDRALTANIAGFYQRYKGFQLNTFTGISFLVASIPEVTSRGFDLDLAWNTGISGLTLTGGATYADTRYGDFTPPAGVNPRLPGNRLNYAPQWNVTGGFNSRTAIVDGLDLLASASVKWSSAYNTGSNLDPVKIQDPYAWVNARIGIAPPGDGWTLELWARNLTNAEVFQVIVDQTLQAGSFAGFPAPPRTYGLTGRVRF